MKTERRNVKRRRTTVSGEDTGATTEGVERSTSDGTYEIQGILGSRIVNGKEEFHVKWKGFGMADCTWEPEENIHARELLAKFKQQEGMSKRKRRTIASDVTKSKREPRSRKSLSVMSAAEEESVAVEECETSETSSSVPNEEPENPPRAAASDGTTSSNRVNQPVSSESTEEPSTEEPNTCVTISSSEIVSSSWISPGGTPPAMKKPGDQVEGADIGLISSLDGQPFDEKNWKVEHLGPPPCKGVAGHWALVVRNDGVQEYIPMETVRRYFPNRLFDYLLPRIQFRKDE